MISYDGPRWDGETNSKHSTRECKNADHARCRIDDGAATATVVAGVVQLLVVVTPTYKEAAASLAISTMSSCKSMGTKFNLRRAPTLPWP